MSVGKDMIGFTRKRNSLHPREILNKPMGCTILLLTGFMIVFTAVRLYECFGGLYVN